MEDEIRKQYSNEDMVMTDTDEYYCEKHNLRKPHRFNRGDSEAHCPNCLHEQGVLFTIEKQQFSEDEIVIYTYTDEAYGVAEVLEDTRAFEYSLDTVPGIYRTVASVYENCPNNDTVIILYDLSDPSDTFPVPESVIEPVTMIEDSEYDN